jgi:hypothetical protein
MSHMPRQSHASGKLVVIAMIALGVALGLVGFIYRHAVPPPPATQPSTLPT